MSALKKLAARLRPKAGASRCGLIGLHLSATRLQLVQLERNAGRDRLRASACVPLMGGRDAVLGQKKTFKATLRRALEQGPFKGRKVISTMPLNHVKLMTVSYPAVAPEAEAPAIARLLAERLDGALNDYVVDYVPVRTSIRDGERLCMVAASPREAVIDYLDALTAAGLEVEALEVGPLSLRRLIEAMSSSDNIENVLAVNTTNTTTYLTLISGRRLLSNQAIDFGERQLIDSIAGTLDVSPRVARNLLKENGLRKAASPTARGDISIAETLQEIVRPAFLKLVKEVDRAFLYAASESFGQDNRRIYLFGGLAQWDGTDELLGTLLQAPVARLDASNLPFDCLQADPVPAGTSAAEFAVASGLAYWGLDGND